MEQGLCIHLGELRMGWLRSEEEVDELIEEMLKKGKGKYVTQSVVFNKSNARHMDLLKKVLMSSESFSGFTRELIAEKFSGKDIQVVGNDSSPIEEKVEKKDTGNFL